MRWKFWERKQPPASEDIATPVITTEPPLATAAAAEVPEEELAEVVVGEPEPETATPRQGFLRFLKERLSKTRQGLLKRIDRLLSGRRSIDAELFDDLEEVLISSDLGVQTTMRIMQELQQSVKEQRLREPVEIRTHLKESLLDILDISAGELCTEVATPPAVILMVGVNGVGKTTTIA